MAELGSRIENVLNEARMLILGGQVLLGFTYRICFEPAFERLPFPAQLSEIVSLGLMTAGLAWLIWPAAFHRLALQGRQTENLHRFASSVLDWALLPFAVGLGLSLYPVCLQLQIGRPWLVSAAATAMGLLFWYLAPLVKMERPGRPKRASVGHDAATDGGGERKDDDRAELSDRIKKVLIECRMALPGAQAFLGFQFAIVFTEGFEKLPRASRMIHFGSLLSSTVAIVLLIAPAAFHRIAESGEDTSRFHRVASGFLLAALVFLAPGMAGDLFVVLWKVLGSLQTAAWTASILLAAFYGLWFGLSLARRERPG
jgi:hypothetical protein